MEKLKLTIEEFLLFKTIAFFVYEFTVSKGFVLVIAEASKLKSLGY